MGLWAGTNGRSQRRSPARHRSRRPRDPTTVPTARGVPPGGRLPGERAEPPDVPQTQTLSLPSVAPRHARPVPKTVTAAARNSRPIPLADDQVSSHDPASASRQSLLSTKPYLSLAGRTTTSRQPQTCAELGVAACTITNSTRQSQRKPKAHTRARVPHVWRAPPGRPANAAEAAAEHRTARDQTQHFQDPPPAERRRRRVAARAPAGRQLTSGPQRATERSRSCR